MSEEILKRGGLRDEVYERLVQLLRRGPADGGLVVFDFDNTCILGDIGELFSHYLIDEMLYRFDLPAFWELVDPADGRAELREIATEAAKIPREERRGHETYEVYLAEMGALYGRRYKRAGARDCYEWAVRLHVGMRPEEIRAWTGEAIRREIARTVEVERRRTEAGEEVEIGRGIRVLQEMRGLVGAFQRREFDVWIVSATNLWSVQVFAEYYGVGRDRVLGNRVSDRDGVLTGEAQTPVLYREGKVAIIEEVIGKTPLFVAGDSVTDLEMLREARELAMVVDVGNQVLREEGSARGWAFQPQRELTTTQELTRSAR